MRKKILALMLTVMIGSAQVMTVSAAKSTDELEQQKAQTTAQLNETQDSINDLESKKEAITNQIGELDAQLVVTMAAVETLKTDIANKQTEIEETQQKLEAAQQDQAEQYEALKSRIQYLYENGGNTAWASLLLSGEDLSEILNQAEYTQKMYDYDRECLEKYMEITQQVSDYSDQLATEKAELEASEAEQEAQQAQLQNMLAEKKATSADYDAQLADMQAKAAEYESLIEEQNAQIQAIQEQQAAEAAAQAAAEEAARQQEAEAQQAAREAAAESNRQSSSNSSSDTQNSSSNTNSNTNSNKNNSSKTEDTSDNVSPSSGTGQDVVNYAVQFVGNPYVWGRDKPDKRSGLFRIYHECIRSLRLQPAAFFFRNEICGKRSVLCGSSAGRYYLLRRPCGDLHGRRTDCTCKQRERRYQNQQQCSVPYDSCSTPDCLIRRLHIRRREPFRDRNGCG